MIQDEELRGQIEKKLALEYEGKAFEHIWLCKIGEQWHVHKDFYAILGGEVFYLKHDTKVLSGDSLFSTVKDCICVGEYNPAHWYQPVQRSYEHSVFKALTNIADA